MPIYEFKCENCGMKIEKLCGVGEVVSHCPQCGASMKRCISVFAYKKDRTSERERNILKLATDYLKDGKVKDAQRFLKKASEYVKTDTIKKAADTLTSKLEK